MNQNESIKNGTNFNDYATKKVINFETTPIVDIVNYILITASKKMLAIFILILLITI